MKAIARIVLSLLIIIVSFISIVVIDDTICILFAVVLAAGLIMFFSEIKRILKQ